MEKLEIKHIAPYLPYGVKLWHTDWECQLTMDALGSGCNYFSIEDVNDYAKPILRPLSDLTKEIEHNGERFVPYQRLYLFASNMGIHKGTFEHMLNSVIEGNTCITELPYYLVIKLIEWHFDVFGLIEKGLAINKNEI